MNKKLLKKLQVGILSLSALGLLAACGPADMEDPEVDDEPAVEEPADEEEIEDEEMEDEDLGEVDEEE